jgi:hypothetical protein
MNSRELLYALPNFRISEHIKSTVNSPMVIKDLNSAIAESAHRLVRHTLRSQRDFRFFKERITCDLYRGSYEELGVGGALWQGTKGGIRR